MRIIKKPQLGKKNQRNTNADSEEFRAEIPSKAQKRDIFSTIDENFAFITQKNSL